MSGTDIFDFDPTTVSASIEVLPKDEYEFQIGEPKAFINKPKEQADGTTKPAAFGIRWQLTVVRSANNPDTVGRKVFMNGYMHVSGSQSMTKAFVMAANGYHTKGDEEKEFNEKTKGMSWKFNPEDGSTGDVWKSCTGQRVIADVDVQKAKKEGDQDNNQFRFRPVSDGFKQEQEGR